jgi:hypothetical protein
MGTLILSDTGINAQTPNNFTRWHSLDSYHLFYQGDHWAISLKAIIQRIDLIQTRWHYTFSLTLVSKAFFHTKKLA